MEPGVETETAELDFAIAIQGLSVRYGETLAVRDLSLHIPPGAIYGLVGPSGAGKTTVMRILATVQPPSSGIVLVDGIDLQAEPAAVRERIGYLPDVAGVYEAFTVREYLNFYGALFQLPARRRRQSTDELIELFGLADLGDRPVGSLSRGRKQQLSIARCLVHEPSVLLLDEPAAGMDPRSRIELRDILRELARFGTTILLSSNLLSELAAVCTHLGFMQGGELIAEGETSEIMRAVAPDARLRVVLLHRSDCDAARAVLEAQPDCREIEVRGDGELSAWYSGTREDLAGLLEQLAASGIAVAEFGLEHPSLDDVFLRLAAIQQQERGGS